MNRRASALLLGAFVLAAATTTVPGAQAEDAECNIVVPAVTVEPGLSTEPNSGVFHTHTETGTIDCGDRGKGTIGLDGRYGTKDPDSCQDGGEGWGIFSVSLGDEHWKDTFNVKFGTNTEGTDAGQIDGERLSGKYTFTGTEGNCVTAPITKGDIRFAATLKG